jgi:nitric oxide reductase activation protein
VYDGDNLNWDDLVRYAVDRKRRDVPDDRVYERRDRAARDVATAFLVDLSASTDDPVVKPDATPSNLPADGSYPHLRDPYDDDPYLWAATPPESTEAPRRILDVLRESLWLMAAGLNDWGDAFAVYGFSGYGRLCVEFAVAKEFREPWDARAARALVAMKPRRSTRMGPAIRHAQRKLAATGAALKILVVLSDGFPQDCDYGPDRGNHEYGVADTGQALREAEAAGVRTFCVTVDRSGHDYLQSMCPDDRYRVIEDIDALPGALARIYRHLAT